jgi:hypothetical protein
MVSSPFDVFDINNRDGNEARLYAAPACVGPGGHDPACSWIITWPMTISQYDWHCVLFTHFARVS